MATTEQGEQHKPATPELDKLTAASADGRVVSDFYDWLQTEHITLCSYVEPSPENGHSGGYYPVHIPPEELLRRWKGIDSAKVEAERMALLEYLRSRP